MVFQQKTDILHWNNWVLSTYKSGFFFQINFMDFIKKMIKSIRLFLFLYVYINYNYA